MCTVPWVLFERSEWRVQDRTFLRPACRRHHGQWPEMKRVARLACMEPNSTAAMGPSFNSIRVSARKYSLQAAHRVQATGFSAPHGDLEDGTSWRIAGIHRLSKKGGVEKLNRFAYILPRQLVQDEPRGPRQRTVSIRAWESHGFLPYGHSSGVTGMSRPGRPPFFCPS